MTDTAARLRPTYALEASIGGRVAGVDEAGRGPLSGPVIAAAVILDPAHIPAGIDDSKKLSESAREALYATLTTQHTWAVGSASVQEIEELNILHASMLAMRRAVEGLSPAAQCALIDGNRLPPSLPCPARAIVRGDATSLSIAAASIIAKVTRDRLMRTLAEQHPGYGWERNMGYGTAEHRAALQSLGATPHHRRVFISGIVHGDFTMEEDA